MPKRIVKICKSIQLHFLWGDGGEERKIAWVKREKVCRSKEEGGLGVKDVEVFNNVLL